jgi:hypothetical protein
MATLEQATAEAIEVATAKAERAIQRILCNLENDTLLMVDQVTVDTRNFAQLRTEIHLRRGNRS